jgi:hypothetical protein
LQTSDGFKGGSVLTKGAGHAASLDSHLADCLWPHCVSRLADDNPSVFRLTRAETDIPCSICAGYGDVTMARFSELVLKRLAPLLYWPFFLAAIILVGLGVFSNIGTSYHGKLILMIAGAALWAIGWVVRYKMLERGL